MPKPKGLPTLNLSATKKDDGQQLNPMSPQSVVSPRSIESGPTSPMPQSPQPPNAMQPIQASNSIDRIPNGNGSMSPHMTAIPDIPSSPDRETGRHGRDTSKSFFSNLLASKSSHKLHSSEPSIAENEKSSARSRGNSRERTNYELHKKSSKPELPRMVLNNGKSSSEFQDDGHGQLVPPGSSDGNSISQKKSRSKLGGILNRTKAMKIEDENRKKVAPPNQPSGDNVTSQNGQTEPMDPSLIVAPLKIDHREQAFADSNGSAMRTRSADRSREDNVALRKPGTSSSLAPSALKDSSMFSSIQSTGKGVSDRWGRAGKGLLGKFSRTASSTERDMPPEENYVCTTINLPLVQQTRKTRIAKRLELSRDKTEFWMPALPWRCIDYLNMNGCEEEGLYRIPGSGREVKVWQKKFDTEFDINLFEASDLYDINTIGSMFKSWLRELPDEILPKATQAKISRECAGATSTPQLLKDELSKLPPFNYYLLFAITCHLSLLHSFADKNKMDYRNLCICFQPCLKIDAFCFQFLVINWKECWQGCWTEHEFLQEEYRWEREGSQPAPRSASVDERAVSSSGSNQPPASFQQTLRGVDAGVQRKNSAPGTYTKNATPSAYNKNRNTTIAMTTSHTTSSSMPAVPRVVSTPPRKTTPEQELPELGDLSPLRM